MKAKKKRKPSARRQVDFPGGVGGVKMSEALDEFVEPLKRDDMTEEELFDLFGTGLIAWNLAFLPEAEWQKNFDVLTEPMELNGIERAKLWAAVSKLIRRKLENFAHIDRIILDFWLTPDEDTVHLQVLSTPSPPPKSPGP
jgi:hypothetical protein